MDRVLKVEPSRLPHQPNTLRTGSRSALMQNATRFQRASAFLKQPSKPSIERTSPGKPELASHVKS